DVDFPWRGKPRLITSLQQPETLVTDDRGLSPALLVRGDGAGAGLDFELYRPSGESRSPVLAGYLSAQIVSSAEELALSPMAQRITLEPTSQAAWLTLPDRLSLFSLAEALPTTPVAEIVASDAGLPLDAAPVAIAAIPDGRSFVSLWDYCNGSSHTTFA